MAIFTHIAVYYTFQFDLLKVLGQNLSMTWLKISSMWAL